LVSTGVPIEWSADANAVGAGSVVEWELIAGKGAERLEYIGDGNEEIGCCRFKVGATLFQRALEIRELVY